MADSHPPLLARSASHPQPRLQARADTPAGLRLQQRILPGLMLSLLWSCQTNATHGWAAEQEPLGGMGEAFVAMADAAMPGGSMELTMDRRGQVMELEATLNAKHTPTHLVNRLTTWLPGASIMGCEWERTPEGDHMELQCAYNGEELQVIFHPKTLAVVQVEVALDAQQIPPPLLEAARRELTDALGPSTPPTSLRFEGADWLALAPSMEGAELLKQRPPGNLYHIKWSSRGGAGAHYKVVLGPEGRVQAMLREIPAEIEIPIRPASQSRGL